MKTLYEDNDILDINEDWLTYVESNLIEENIYGWNNGLKAMGDLINNPYGVLGIPSNINNYDINMKYDKLLKKTRLNMKISNEFDYNRLWTFNRNLADLQTAFFEIQRIPYGLIWINEPYFKDSSSIQGCQRRFYLSKFDIDSFSYDDFVVSFLFLVLNDPTCNFVYHWSYMLRVIALMFLSGNEFWDKIKSERTKLLLIDLSTEEIKEYYIKFFMNPVFNLIRQAIQKKNVRTIVNWYYILNYSSLGNVIIERVIVEIKDALDDITDKIYKELRKYFYKMIEDSKNNLDITIISQDQIEGKMDKITLPLENIFKIIGADTQKGRRIRKPLYDIFRLVANIYMRGGYHNEFRTMMNMASKCVYDWDSRMRLEEDKVAYNQYYGFTEIWQI
jgi:hypothetical protein